MNPRPFLAAWLLILTVACATDSRVDDLNAEQKNAVCAAQSFLRSNGYLDRPVSSDRDAIKLELWDKLTYSRNGEMDWSALLAARSGTFVGRLYGVKALDGGFLVAYKMPHGFRCAFVDAADYAAVHLNEANCHPEGPDLERVSDASLECPAGNAN